MTQTTDYRPQTTDFAKSEYFHIGRASDLKNKKDRIIYRFLEILPAFLSWGTVIGAIIFSYVSPVIASLFIIIFDIYWLLKTIYLSTHLYQNWRRVKHNLKRDWKEALSSLKYEHIYHLVILPFYKEPFEVVNKCIESIARSEYDKSKMFITLAVEKRAGIEALQVANKIKEMYGNTFASVLISIHPEDIVGELAGKGSNTAYAAEKSRVEILDKNKINYDDVLVSAFDIDTVIYPKYFECLTWHFLTAENPYRSSYQPVPFYNNNLWESNVFSRVVAGSGTFWQMIQQERPDLLVTFSSHSVPFKTLYEVNYWQRNMVSEDSRIFWNAYMAFNGNYTVVPLSYPVSMDANLAKNFFVTLKNIYLQQRRWSWGAENVPYILFGFIKNRSIPLAKKIKTSLIQLEGYWSLATNPILILFLGWLPLVLGGRAFNQTILSYNLPFVTRNLMILAMVGLVFSAIVFYTFLPDPNDNRGRGFNRYLLMLLQWVLVPFTIFIFGAIPGLDAQMRLALGRYMGFWVTPKER